MVQRSIVTLVVLGGDILANTERDDGLIGASSLQLDSDRSVLLDKTAELELTQADTQRLNCYPWRVTCEKVETMENGTKIKSNPTLCVLRNISENADWIAGWMKLNGILEYLVVPFLSWSCPRVAFTNAALGKEKVTIDLVDLLKTADILIAEKCLALTQSFFSDDAIQANINVTQCLKHFFCGEGGPVKVEMVKGKSETCP
mmetsp:Transcript_6009/g.8179  ORF Transcript_6009/g.8179 Transcript_6009/m.8179 type:complete len:202 (+) Transcript_6009:37-642(+)